jgi:Ser/Thr protein kinase RdoA (MazF antagonist)
VDRHADPLCPPFPWLLSASSPELMTWIRLGLNDLPRVVAANWPNQFSDDDLERLARADVTDLVLRAHHEANRISLCHGDAWAGNVLFRHAGGQARPKRAVLIDWQFAMWGNPLSDVAMLLLSSLSPESGSAWKDELLAVYHETLTSDGALDYSLADCLDDLRRAGPFAAVVTLASVEAHTTGMTQEELSGFGARIKAAIDLVGRV